MLVRRIPFLLLAAVAPVLGGLTAPPARAAELITSSFDRQVAHPGETVTLKITFTNPETVDVVFTFLTVNTVYDTITDRTKFTGTGCTGEISDCNHFTAPIPPGGTRTMTRPYAIAADSPCGENINLAFFYYSYRESAAGAFEALTGSPVVTVRC